MEVFLAWYSPIYQASLLSQLVKNLPAMQFNSWVRKIHWWRDRLPTPLFLGFPGGSAGKESSCNEGDLGSIPGLGRSPGKGKGYPLQYSGLENSMDCLVQGFTKMLHMRIIIVWRAVCPVQGNVSCDPVLILHFHSLGWGQTRNQSQQRKPSIQ